MRSAPATPDVRPVSRLFRALGDETRVRIVALLAHGELCVCHLEEALGLPQPSISRQLAVLRSAGVVVARREGSWVHYRLLPQADAECARQLQALVRSYGRQHALRRHCERLVSARGPACR